jgi:uncharacterized protein YndB with AHSA1/START domain
MNPLCILKHTGAKAALAAIILLLLQGAANASVADSSSNGFTVRIVTNIHATPATVYRSLIHIGEWWSSEHTYSGDAHNLSIDERPLGCFCEKLANRGSMRHMEVLFVAPGKTLRMSGGLGPLQALAAAATLTFSLSPESGGTKLEVTYAVGGYYPQGMNFWATPVDTVLSEQVTRLKSYIETGNPASKGQSQKPH